MKLIQLTQSANALVLLCSLFLANNAQGSTPCSSLWVNGFPEAARLRDAGECHPFTPSTIRLSRSQQMFFQENTVNDPAIKQTLEWAAEALGYSSVKYSFAGNTPKIRIIFSSRPYASGTGVTPAFTYTEFYNLGTEFCPIVLYPDHLTFSKAHQMQIVAHEVYHCFQKTAWPAQVSDVVQGRSEGMFWFESIAQFMSNDVYPSHDFEYHPMFGRYDTTLPFMEQESPYLAEGFFQSLFWSLGASPSRIHHLQASLGRAGRSAAEDVVALPNIGQNFHKASRDISFQELRDSSSAIAPWHLDRRVLQVPDTPTSRVTVQYMDLAIEPFELVFPKRGRYRVSLDMPAGSKLSIRTAGDTTWLDRLPDELSVDCDSDLKMEGIITRATADQGLNTATLNIIRESNQTCTCEVDDKPTDSCLFGEWEVDREDVVDFMNRATSGALQIKSVTGTLKLTFTPEGDRRWDYQNLMVDARTTASSRWDRPIDVRMIWNGINAFNYRNSQTAGRSGVCSKARSTGVTARAEASVEGSWRPMPVPIEPVRGEGVIFYTCRENEFQYEIQAGRIPLNWTFRRIR